MIQAGSRAVLTSAQLHGSPVLSDCQVVSVDGANAIVSVDSEFGQRSVPVAMLASSTQASGDNLSRPNEMPVIDAIRR